jgi:membrane protein
MQTQRDGAPRLAVDLTTALAVGAIVALAAMAHRFSAPIYGRLPGVTKPSIVDTHAHPLDISSRGWRQLLKRTFADFNEDRIPAVAAGVTFFALLALFPALGAIVSLYGLFSDATAIRSQFENLSGLLPGGALTVIGDQLARLTSTNHGQLGLTFLASLLISIWSANAGIKALIEGLNVAYDAQEHRSFLSLNAQSLSFTVGITLFVVASSAVLVAAPNALHRFGLGWIGASTLPRLPAMWLITSGLLSVLYRYGPSRPRARWRWITPGGIAAAFGWLGMSWLFSWYVSNFGHYNATYGSLGAVVGFMTWIWLSLIVVLVGAELNSQLELQAVSGPRSDEQRF